MKFSTEIFDELKLVSPLLADIEKRNVFSVPEGYFEVLAINVLKGIRAGTNLDIDKLSVPEGYFENLSSLVLTKIKSLEQDDPANELRSLSPMLYSIQNENVYTVPTGYFRDLQYEILYKVKPQAKVVALSKSNSIWKYAAAAVVTGFIGLSSLMMFNSSGTSANSDTKLLIQTANQFTNEQQINGAIATLSEDEIIKYLERTGTDIDNEALATGIDANELPESTDYMLDEKTLDTYLNTDRNSQN